jgi:hypothetical protein
VDWAVFTASAFNLNFGGGGYIPSGPLVYTHQIFTTDVLAPVVGASGMSIALPGNPAGNAGGFSAGGVAGVPVALAFADPSIADWSLTGETDAVTPSEGLAYSSTHVPQLTGVPVVVDGGLSAATILMVGIPSSIQIPEPATLFMASFATLLLLIERRGRRS